MSEFIIFFIIICGALLFSEIFNRLHLPWVTALIMAGIVFGPEGLGVIGHSQVVDFFSEIGLVFLMFIAGLEIRLKSFRSVHWELEIITLLSAAIPAAVAVAIGAWFGLGWVPTVLLAAAMVSSSIAIVVPTLEGVDMFHSKLGQTIVAATAILDIIGIVAFSIVVHQVTGSETPLLVLYGMLFVALVLLRLAVPKLEAYLESRENQTFEKEIQLLIGILTGVVALFGILGLEPVEAGFFAGLVLSDSIHNTIARAKLHAIAYGLFIPVFFVMVGAEINLGIFHDNPGAVWLSVAVIGSSIAAKYGSGWLGGRLAGYNHTQSSLIGVSTIPQLNVPLAIAATGFALGMIPPELLTALVILSVVTSFVAPPLISRLAKRVRSA